MINSEITEPQTRQGPKWIRTKVSRLSASSNTILAIKPNFIPPPKESCPPSLGFYLEDQHGRVYTAYLRGINQRDIDSAEETGLQKTFRVIVTGIGRILNDGTQQVFLRPAINIGDQFYLEITDRHDYQRRKFVGHFNKSLVFINPGDKGLKLKLGAYVRAEVIGFGKNQRFIETIAKGVVDANVFANRVGLIIKKGEVE